MRKTIGILTAAILSLCFTVTTQASIVINGTRVVYPLDKKDISVHFDNRGNIPSLTQVWIDDGNRDTPIDKLNVPFIITPAMSRVEPGKGQTIRIIYTGSGTAKNEESIYWLNVLDIPGLAKKAVPDNYLQMAIRSRIKLFLRPAGLSADGLIKASEKISWKIVNTGGKAQLRATNSSPYHVTITGITLTSTGGKTIEMTHGGMAYPNSTLDIDLPKAAGQVSKINYTSLSDSGAALKFESALK